MRRWRSMMRHIIRCCEKSFGLSLVVRFVKKTIGGYTCTVYTNPTTKEFGNWKKGKVSRNTGWKFGHSKNHWRGFVFSGGAWYIYSVFADIESLETDQNSLIFLARKGYWNFNWNFMPFPSSYNPSILRQLWKIATLPMLPVGVFGISWEVKG